jgi:uncharacterized Zn-binding protein involved in type VI secretion
MRRCNITVGAKTTAGGTVLTGCNRANIGGQPISREGDSVLLAAPQVSSPIPRTKMHKTNEDQGWY